MTAPYIYPLDPDGDDDRIGYDCPGCGQAVLVEANGSKTSVKCLGLCDEKTALGRFEPGAILAAVRRREGQGEIPRSSTNSDQQAGPQRSNGIVATPLSEEKYEQIEFIYHGIPKGMLTLLMGDPGLGKSQFTIHVAAELTKEAHNVLLLSAEDNPGAVILPRAIAAGADLSRLHTVEISRDGIGESLAFPDDAEGLDRLIAETQAKLVVIDPLMAHLSEKVHSYRDQSIRQALNPLHKIAEKRGTTFLLVAHLNKGESTQALYRAGGSIGLPAAVRSALLLARDPEDPDPERGSQRVIAHVKSNVGRQQETLSATVEAVELADGTEAPRLVVTGVSTASTASLLDHGSRGESRSAMDSAVEFLEIELAEGERPVTALKAAARDAGIGWRTIEAAKKKLAVVAEKSGFGSGWTWKLPEGRNDEDRKPITPSSAAFGETALECGNEDRSGHEDRKAAEIAVFGNDAAPPAPPCRYPEHRGKDWASRNGKVFCGVCTPKVGGAS